MDPTPINKTGNTVIKEPLVITSPDSTVISVEAIASGMAGVPVSLRSTYTVNGTTPVLSDDDPARNYTLGDEQSLQVIPPMPLALYGEPTRPYTLKLLVAATLSGETYQYITPVTAPTPRTPPVPTGNTISVGVGQDYETLPGALSAAVAGDILILSAEEFVLTSKLTVDKPITIQGLTTDATISSSTLATMIEITSAGVTLKDLTITHSRASTGANVAVLVSSLTADDVYFDGCLFTPSDTAIDIKAAEFQVTGCEFSPPTSGSQSYYGIKIRNVPSGRVCIIDGNSLISGLGDQKCVFALVTGVASASGSLSGTLSVGNIVQLTSPNTLKHLLRIEDLTGSNFKLFIHGNTLVSEGDAPVLLYGSSGHTLGIFDYIYITDNAVQNTAQKGLLAIDAPSLVDMGSTVMKIGVGAEENVLTTLSFAAGWASATYVEGYVAGYYAVRIAPSPSCTEPVPPSAPANQVQAFFDIIFAESPVAITGLTPYVVAGEATKVLPPVSDPVVTTDGDKTITTTAYATTVEVDDPESLELLVRLACPPYSLGKGNIQFATSLSPDPSPDLPDYSDPINAELPVGDSLSIYGAVLGEAFRGDMPTRHLYAKVRATDYDYPNNIYVAEIDLQTVARTVLRELVVLVKYGAETVVLEDLPVVDGAYQVEAGDSKGISLVLRATGTLGYLILFEGSVHSEDDPPPASTEELGTYGMDIEVPLLSTTAAALRADWGGMLRCLVSGTSPLNAGNSIQKEFNLRVTAPVSLTGLGWYYINSQNPDSCLPLEAGTDINGTITGAGVHDDPYIVPVAALDRLQVFVAPQQVDDEGTAQLQSGYAFESSPIDPIYPSTPGGWYRAFTRLEKATVLPHPVPPTAAALVPFRGDELIAMSGGTQVGGSGTDPGYSTLIHLWARGTAVDNAGNSIEADLWLRVADPSVL